MVVDRLGVSSPAVPTNSTAAAGTIEHIDPTLIVVEANVRSEAALGREFVASIKANGVLTPILARRDDQGNIIVRAGQRRTLAAREAGLATIPVYIVEADEMIVERIVQQMAENAVAASAIVSHSLTLYQAARLIEFEGDEETVSGLIDIATNTPERFAHAAQRARDEARIESIKATATADLIERGYEILDRDRGSYESDYISISYLSTADGERVTVQHLTDAVGRAAYVYAYASSDTAFVRYYLKDPKAAGFRKSSGSGATSGPMTDDEKAERKTLIANNKAWVSAEVVRREWLAEFLSRKTLPTDAAKAIAFGLTVHHGVVGKAIQNGNVLAHTLLGLERAHYFSPDKLSALVEHFPTKAQHATLAIVLAGIEDSTSKGTWRYPDTHSARYLEQLSTWGYSLSEVERIMIDAVAEKATPTADEAAATVTQE